MATRDEAVVIDALAKDIDLSPFFDLMANESVMKVFHAARQDIEIVWNLARKIPHPIFDTQVAAMVLGYGDFDLLRPAGAAHHRRHAGQVEPLYRLDPAAADRGAARYAVSDVTHLRDVYLKLSSDLNERGRTDWVRAEMEVLTAPDTYKMEPERAWERLKSRVRKPKDLAVLIEVAAWREREAQTRDVPRGRVLKDDVLGDIATQAPTTIETLGELRSLPRGFERSRWGDAIVEAVKRGLARDPEEFAAHRAFQVGAATAQPPSSCSRCCCA